MEIEIKYVIKYINLVFKDVSSNIDFRLMLIKTKLLLILIISLLNIISLFLLYLY